MNPIESKPPRLSLIDLFWFVAFLGLVAAVAAIFVYARNPSLPIPPCYELAKGPRLCITAEPISEKAFFERPAGGTTVWCVADTAGKVVCQ